MSLSDEQLNQIIQKYQLSPASNPSQNSNSLRGADLLKSLEDNNDQNTISNTISEQPKKGLLEKTADIFDNTFGKAGDALFGTTARTAGNAIGMFGTGVKDLITGDYKKVGTPEYKKDVFSKDFEKMTSSPKKTLGNAVAIVAEGLPFMGGGEAKVAGIGGKTLEKIIPETLNATVKSSKYVKPFIEGAKYGSLYSAADSLKKEDPLSTTVKKTAFGGIGGGLVGMAGTAIGQAGKAIKNTISPDVEAALTKAIKPKGNNAKFAESLKTALPDIQETAQTLGQKIENIDHLDDVITQAKKRVWKNYEDILGPNANSQIDGNKIADNIVKGIDKRFITQNPEKYKKIVAVADTYRRPMSLTEAEDFLQSTNNELHSYYAKNKVQQAVAMGDPEVSHIVRENDALRNELNTKLSELTGVNAKEIKNRYGALSNLQSEIVPRKNVIARQNPIGLAEQIGYGRAAGNILKSAANFQLGDAAAGAADLATTRFLKLKNDPNELIRSAFQKLEKNPTSKYAKAMTKFIPAGYLPEKASPPNQINLPSEGILEGQSKLRR
jgi:cytochrome c556